VPSDRQYDVESRVLGSGRVRFIEVEGDTDAAPIYLSRPFEREPNFTATSVNYALDELLARVEHQV
jgi:hypothetical protein